MRWKLEDWEATVEKIVDESNRMPKQSGKQRVLMNWRAKLQKEPNLLQAFRIDAIVREVRRRLKGDGKSYELTAGLYGYVLPGSQRRWPLDPARLKLVGHSPKMESQLNGAPVSITVADTP